MDVSDGQPERSPWHGYGPSARPSRRGTDEVENEAQWEQHAGWWQREYSAGADPEYEDQILPAGGRPRPRSAPGARRRVRGGPGRPAHREHGCDGGGRRSHRRSARRWPASAPAAPTTSVRAPKRCPVRAGAFDTVVLCLALEHVDAFETAIHEVARVLEPGGRFVLVLCHPLLQAPGAGWIDDQIVGEQYWRIGAYLPEDRAFDEVAPGVDLLFIHRPLSRYVHAMGEAGLLDRRHDRGATARQAHGRGVGLPGGRHDPPDDARARRSDPERRLSEHERRVLLSRPGTLGPARNRARGSGVRATHRRTRPPGRWCGCPAARSRWAATTSGPTRRTARAPCAR